MIEITTEFHDGEFVPAYVEYTGTSDDGRSATLSCEAVGDGYALEEINDLLTMALSDD